MNLRSRGTTNLVARVEDIKAHERRLAKEWRTQERAVHLERLGLEPIVEVLQDFVGVEQPVMDNNQDQQQQQEQQRPARAIDDGDAPDTNVNR